MLLSTERTNFTDLAFQSLMELSTDMVAPNGRVARRRLDLPMAHLGFRLPFPDRGHAPVAVCIWEV